MAGSWPGRVPAYAIAGRFMATAVLTLVMLAGISEPVPLRVLPAQAAEVSLTSLQREQYVMNWAITQAGAWYRWGGTGPYSYGYDCSGLVYAAFRRYGIDLPRSTYSMLGSWHLYRVYSPRRGDLAFFGSGHVEFVTAWYHTTFGELHSGTRAGWHKWYSGSWWHPTAYYRVR